MFYLIRFNILECWIKKVNDRRRIYHRKNNKPAIIRNGEKKYFLRGQLHRENDLPAVDYKNIKEYWVHGKKYEIITHSNGTKEWWFYSDDCSITNNKAILHRFYNQPAIEYANGDKEWHFYGKLHRTDGPAVIYGNKQYWFENGEFKKESPIT